MQANSFAGAKEGAQPARETTWSQEPTPGDISPQHRCQSPFYAVAPWMLKVAKPASSKHGCLGARAKCVAVTMEKTIPLS